MSCSRGREVIRGKEERGKRKEERRKKIACLVECEFGCIIHQGRRKKASRMRARF